MIDKRLNPILEHRYIGCSIRKNDWYRILIGGYRYLLLKPEGYVKRVFNSSYLVERVKDYKEQV